MIVSIARANALRYMVSALRLRRSSPVHTAQRMILIGHPFFLLCDDDATVVAYEHTI